MPLSSGHATTASVERNRSRGRPRSFGERAPALVLPRGRRLHDGDPGDSMLVVTGGHFARRLTTRAGRECMFRVYSPGDVFGRIAVAPLEVSGAARRGAARRPPGSTVDHLPRRRTSWCRSTRTRSLARAPMQRRQDASRPIHRSRLVRTVTVHVPVGDNFTPRSYHAASGGDGVQLALPSASFSSWRRGPRRRCPSQPPDLSPSLTREPHRGRRIGGAASGWLRTAHPVPSPVGNGQHHRGALTAAS